MKNKRKRKNNVENRKMYEKKQRIKYEMDMVRDEKNKEFCSHLIMIALNVLFFSKAHPNSQIFAMIFLTLVAVFLLYLIWKAEYGSKELYSACIVSILLIVLYASRNNFSILSENRVASPSIRLFMTR